jgi:toxin ParE1/3/4
MGKVVWTPTAERDLEGIFSYVGRQRRSQRAGTKVIQEIDSKAQFYAEQPFLTQARSVLGCEVRAFTVFWYVVIFRPNSDGIEVLRVIHGARDVARIFREEIP